MTDSLDIWIDIFFVIMRDLNQALTMIVYMCDIPYYYFNDGNFLLSVPEQTILSLYRITFNEICEDS